MQPEEEDLIKQVPVGNNLESSDESKKTCNIREGQTQATSAPDMSVDAVIHRDYPP